MLLEEDLVQVLLKVDLMVSSRVTGDCGKISEGG